MEIKELKKVTKLHPYTINEFVKDLVDTRKNIEEEKENIEVRIEELETELGKVKTESESSSSEELDLNERLSKAKEEKEQADEILRKWEAEKERITQELDKKIEKFRTSVKENEEKKAEQENKIKENEAKMAEIYEANKDKMPLLLPEEYFNLESENKDINKKISRIKGNLTRYDKKINDLIEIKGNLENENILEGLQPPRTISRVRTRGGKLVSKVQPIKETPIKETPVKETPVKETPAKEIPVKEEPVKKDEPSKTAESTKTYSEMTNEELENKKRELYAKIVEGDEYFWRAHNENGMEEHRDDPIDEELKLIQEELNKRKEKEESIRDDEVKPAEEEKKEVLPAEIKKPNIFTRAKNWIKKIFNGIKKDFSKAFKEDEELKSEEKTEEIKTDFIEKVEIDEEKVWENILSGKEEPENLDKIKSEEER